MSKAAPKFIITEMQPEGDGRAGIPVVIMSTHLRFVPGYRFDYGFLQIALREGYSVTILNDRTWEDK